MASLNEEEQRYLGLLNAATDIDSASNAKSKLDTLITLKWDNVPLEQMKNEINERFAAQPDRGIFKSDYKKWQKQLESDNQVEIIEATRKLLTVSDRVIYKNIYTEKLKAINDAAEAAAGSNQVVPGGTGNATLSGGTVSTVTVDDQGVAHIESTTDTVTVPGGSAIGGKVDYSQYEQDVMQLDRRPNWVDTNTEYHRIKTQEGFVVDSAIIKKYYSIIDAEVYFGNEYVEDVHDIHWAIQQNVQPLFGYNSYTYDEVARGNRLIMGSFTIVFTSPNYLFSILKEADKANITLVENMASYEVPKLGDNVTPGYRNSAYGQREQGHHAPLWPQTFDIDIIFGEKTGAGDPVHVILLGVAIQSCQQILDASASSGPPIIMEQYQFLAQDIKTSVLSSTGTDKISASSSNASPPSDTANSSTTSTAPTAEEIQADRNKTAETTNKEKEAQKEAQDIKDKEALTGWRKAEADGWQISTNIAEVFNDPNGVIYKVDFTWKKGKGTLTKEDKTEWAKAVFNNLLSNSTIKFDSTKYEVKWTYDEKKDTLIATVIPKTTKTNTEDNIDKVPNTNTKDGDNTQGPFDVKTIEEQAKVNAALEKDGKYKSNNGSYIAVLTDTRKESLRNMTELIDDFDYVTVVPRNSIEKGNRPMSTQVASNNFYIKTGKKVNQTMVHYDKDSDTYYYFHTV